MIDETVFAPVRSQTAFEETLERLGTAIKLGLLVPGERLPAERELCAMLGIARSTLRQALTALVQSGQLHAVRGRGGGTFVADAPPPADPLSPEELAGWRDVCAERFTVEVGVAALAAMRVSPGALGGLDELVVAMDDRVRDFPAYRAADVRFHIGLAEATGSARVLAAMTEVQGAMTDLITHIAHPPEVLEHANAQHARLLSAIRAGDQGHAVGVMSEHLQGTEHVLAGLLPDG
ncbi:MAG: FadR family transcriptional regulator [Solirubrobacterales bacterium]|nr:FadR family transcriptional regulator [Solirubrobacterales bacterium]